MPHTSSFLYIVSLPVT